MKIVKGLKCVDSNELKKLLGEKIKDFGICVEEKMFGDVMGSIIKRGFVRLVEKNVVMYEYIP